MKCTTVTTDSLLVRRTYLDGRLKRCFTCWLPIPNLPGGRLAPYQTVWPRVNPQNSLGHFANPFLNFTGLSVKFGLDFRPIVAFDALWFRKGATLSKI